MDQLAPIDRQILEQIDLVRGELNACTTGHLSSRMGMSRDFIRVRCHMLREAGLVSWTSAAGSLSVVKAPGARLYEQLVISAVEKRAARSGGGGGFNIDEWCREVIADATTEAWYVPAAEQESKDSGDVTSLPPSDELLPTSPPLGEQIRCDVCDRDFKTVTALMGHERSNAHIAKLNAALGVPAA